MSTDKDKEEELVNIINLLTINQKYLRATVWSVLTLSTFWIGAFLINSVFVEVTGWWKAPAITTIITIVFICFLRALWLFIGMLVDD